MIFNRKILTLDEFTIQQLRHIPNATGELSSLLRDLGLAAKRVNVEVNKAGLVVLRDVHVKLNGSESSKILVLKNNNPIRNINNQE